VPKSKLHLWQDAGYQLETPAGSEEARLEREYGDSPGTAFLQGAARTITLGGSDILLEGLDQGEEARNIRERNEGAALGGEVLGAVLPGGAAKLAMGAGKSAAKAVVGTGTTLGAKIGRGAVAGAVEGGVFGVGQGVSEVALSSKPADWESAAATIGSNALGGVVIGGIAGAGATVLAETASATKAYAARKLAAAKAPAGAVDRGAFPEIASMDKKVVGEAIAAEKEAVRLGRIDAIAKGDEAAKAELTRLKAQRDVMAREAHAEAVAFKEFVGDSKNFIVSADAEVKGILGKSNRALKMGLDDVQSFVEARGGGNVVKVLRKQQGALEKVLAGSDDILRNQHIERQAMLDALPQSNYLKPTYLNPEQSRAYAEFAGIKMPRAAKGVEQKALAVEGAELDLFRSAIERNEVHPAALKRVLVAQDMLEKNLALQGRLEALKSPLASEHLAAINSNLEQVKAGLQKSERLEALKAHARDIAEDTMGKKAARLAGGALGGGAGFGIAGPMGGMAGAAAGQAAGARIYDRLVRKIVSGNASRASSIKASVASLFAKGAGLAAKKTVPIASKVLPSISYARKDYVDGIMGTNRDLKPSKDKQVVAFRERARELDAVTQRTPDGQYDVRMHARLDLHERLGGLWAINADAANGIEKTHNARLAFLAGKLPRNPAPPHLQIGPETWEPSKAELAKFGRYMDAVEYPEHILERMAGGTMTPEDAEAMKTVYPEMYQDARNQIMDHLAEVRESLPYQKRLALSIYMDVDADPSVTPVAVTVYQGLYATQQAQQPGGMPGQAAPPKSFKPSEKPTRAQRAGE
jgi:hypothetical protein